jgi:hypothetical protein
MKITPFSGIHQLDPNESLSTDNFAFQGRDRAVIDRLLEVGAVTHRHDGHDALENPTTAPTVTVFSGGAGALGPGISLAVGYTLLDGNGGETELSDVTMASTPAPIPAPEGVPTASVDATAGALRSGLYYYALTLKDATGGETTAGPAFPVTIPQGSSTNRVQFAGLGGLIGDAQKWVIYRSNGGGQPYFMAEGVSDTFTDDGINCQLSIVPPDANTTRGNSFVDVSTPAIASGQPGSPAGFRVYIDADGAFESPCLFGEFPMASAAVPIRVNALDVLDGAPPAISTSIPGAEPIAVGDIDGLTWGPPVADVAALPASGVATGEARVVLASPPSIHAWADGEWHEISGGAGSGGEAYLFEGGGVRGGDLTESLIVGSVDSQGQLVPSGPLTQDILDYFAAHGNPDVSGYGLGLAGTDFIESTTRSFICKFDGVSRSGGSPYSRLQMTSDVGLISAPLVGVSVAYSYDATAGQIRAKASLIADSGHLDPAIPAALVTDYSGTQSPLPFHYGEMDGDVWLGVGQDGTVVTFALWLSDPFAPGAAPASTGSFDLAGTKAHAALDGPLQVSSAAFTNNRANAVGGQAAPDFSHLWWGEVPLDELASAGTSRRLLIGFPDAPASAAMIWDEATGRSPWELQEVSAGASAIAFPKELEFVAGPGVTIGLADNGDGRATITIGLA